MTPSAGTVAAYLSRAREGELELLALGQWPRRDDLDGAATSLLGGARQRAQRLDERRRALRGDRGLVGTWVDLTLAGVEVAQAAVRAAAAVATAPLELVGGAGGATSAQAEVARAAGGLAATYAALERAAREAGDEETAEVAATGRREQEDALEALGGPAGDGGEVDRASEGQATGGEVVAVEATPGGEVVVVDAPAEVVGGGPVLEVDAEDTSVVVQVDADGAAEVVEVDPEDAVAVVQVDADGAAEVVDVVDGPAVVVPGAEVVEAPLDEVEELPDLLAPEAPADPEVVLVETVAEEGAEEGAGAELRIDPPWPQYDAERAADLVSRLEEIDDAETLAAVALYERTHKARRTVLDAADRRLRAISGRGAQT